MIPPISNTIPEPGCNIRDDHHRFAGCSDALFDAAAGSAG